MRRAFVFLALLAACGRPSASPGERVRPRLVVLVVIDQWPSWVFEKQKNLFTRGLGRLLREGAVVREARIPYANTFTAPGHASLATGAPPKLHGIVGNYWYRRAEGRDRPAEYDPDATVFSVGAPLGSAKLSADDNASGRSLRVEGVADVVRASSGGAARSVAIALKPRAACLVAGQRPDLALWYEPGAGGMTTSKAYAAEVPAWLVELARDRPISRYFGSTWDPRDPALLATATGLPDDAPGEKSDHGLGAVFPHALAGNPHPEKAIVETPFGDELVAQTVAVALDAVELGRDEHPDFLAISFGAHDYAGHSWGPDSWEVLDLTLRLDRALGELFELLDARLGADHWAVIVTSDHGATPVVERARIRSARRVPPTELEGAAQKAIAAELGDPGPWVTKIVSGNLYLAAKLGTLAAEARTRALEAAAKAIRGVPGIATAVRTDRFGDCAGENDLERAICEAIVPGEAGELYAVAAAGSSITTYKHGTAHDAPFDDNRRVPILIKAPGVHPQEGEGTLLQVAPTLAALLGVPPPPAAREPTLFGIRRR